MSIALKSLLKDVKFAMKRDLKPGEKLTHVNLGTCSFTESCAEMEKRDGTMSTLHIDHHNDIKEISLNLITRELPTGRVVRLQEETPELVAAIAEADEFLHSEAVRAAEPMIEAVIAQTRKLYNN